MTVRSFVCTTGVQCSLYMLLQTFMESIFYGELACLFFYIFLKILVQKVILALICGFIKLIILAANVIPSMMFFYYQIKMHQIARSVIKIMNFTLYILQYKILIHVL